MARGSTMHMKPSCRAMVRWSTLLKSAGIRLYPLWMIGANMIARLGGMAILVLIGHAYSEADLGTYFQLLAMVGLTVTATQAGSGPLLVRLAQNAAFGQAMHVVATRFLIAGVASILIVTTTSVPFAQYWPLILIPFAAALSPDWRIAAKTRFSQLGMIAVIGQACGIMVAVWASLNHSDLTLYLISPAVSLASLALATAFAFAFAFEQTPSHSTNAEPARKSCAFGLIGFTLLAGFLPNLDFVLLGTDSDPLFLAQRVFLFCAGLIAAIASTLFAKNEVGQMRDIWLLAPMVLIAGLLLFLPGKLADLFYTSPSDDLITILQVGAAWPVLMAFIARQILILQEISAVKWLGWGCLALMIITAFVMPPRDLAPDIMKLIEVRLACLVLILLACQKVATRRQVMA